MKIVKIILISIYVLIVVFATFSLFTFNSFSNSSFGNVTIIGLKDKLYKYNKGDLLLTYKGAIKTGDDILYYGSTNGKTVLSFDKVNRIIKTNEKETTYVIKNKLFLSSSYVIGSSSSVKVIPLFGYLYLFFTSKFGYLISVILPSLVYFIYLVRKKLNA